MLDLVVFGATGFTGKHVVEELARIGNKYGELTWAIAGRSESKLAAVISEVSKKTGQDLSSIRLIVAEVNDAASIHNMCAQARVVVNCCGPYHLYGEPVVKAAVASRTHYVDVTGEPYFMETMQLRYGAVAREAGVYVVSACGFDSVPNDMGVVFLQQHFDGTLNSVESYVSSHVTPGYESVARAGVINYGTWDTIVNSLSTYGDLPTLRKQLYPERLPAFNPVLESRGAIHARDGWCIPFPGADKSVVYRTQRALYEAHGARPVQFRPYVRIGGLFACVCLLLAAVVMYLFSLSRFTRRLLLDHPWLFSMGMVSKDVPSEVAIQNTHFTFLLYGEGWPRDADIDNTRPTKKMTARITGTNPGYGATVVALIFSAITILREKDKMPPGGGVMTTGVAFRNTSLVQHLSDNNLKFEIVDSN